MSIRSRLFGILWAALATLMLMTGLGFVASAYTYHGAVVAHERAADRVERARRAQIRFKKQVQEWKNVLLRSALSDELGEHYWRSFLAEEAQTRAHVEALLALPDTDPEAERLAREFLDAHEALGAEYREARQTLRVDERDPWRADAQVRGLDRPPTDSLDDVVDALIASRTATVQRQERWAIGTLVLCMSLLLLFSLAIGALTRTLLLHWVTHPFGEVVRLAERLGRGERGVPVPHRGGVDEAALLLRSLDSLQKDVQRREAERRAQLEELRAARDTALEAAETKSRFLATMSHELRTPLNGICGAIHLLEEAVDDEHAHLAVLARDSAHTLNALVDDVLTLSRAEHGALEIERLPVDVGALLRDVTVLHSLSERAAKLEVHTEWTDPHGGLLLVDPTRLRQITNNLVGNAVKFTERGSVFVDGRVEDGHLVVSVIDTGIGMSEEELSRVFEVFTQADASTTRRFGGSGMGLAITRSLVHAMGGEVTATSTPDVGTTLRVRIPVERAPASTGMSHSAGASPTGSLPRRSHATSTTDADPAPLVLLVEDNPVNRLLARAMLQRIGARVDEVEDGAQAVEALANGAYDLVFMDIDMPVMDGLTATRAIRAHERTSGRQPSHIVALSAGVLDTERLACFEAGMDDFLAKPIDPQRLEALVRQWRRAA